MEAYPRAVAIQKEKKPRAQLQLATSVPEHVLHTFPRAVTQESLVVRKSQEISSDRVGRLVQGERLGFTQAHAAPPFARTVS